MPRRPVAAYSSKLLAQLAKQYSAFKHEPFDTSGFAPLLLPFRVEANAGDDQKSVAFALSFLLSNDLDWARGNYASRHVYAVFLGRQTEVQSLQRRYEQQSLRGLISRRYATHAVGGILRQSKEGYRGELEIFDKTGQRVCHKTYDKPREFFALLGDMGVDALTFFGHTPSNALVKHLHRKRCTRNQSLVLLGQAGMIGDRDVIDLDNPGRDPTPPLYDRILKNDPGFADVRYWYAKQRSWAGKGRKQLQADYVLALKSYLVERALRDMDYATRANPAVAADFQTWIQQAEALVGPQCRGVLLQRLKAALYTKRMAEKDWRVLEAQAARYPNDSWLLVKLAQAWTNGEGLRADTEMGAGLYIAAHRNYEISAYAKYTSLRELAYCMKNLGRHDVAAAVNVRRLSESIEDRDGSVLLLEAAIKTVEALMQLGRFDEVLQIAATVMPRKIPKEEGPRYGAVQLYATVGTCAAITGNLPVLDGILAAWPQEEKTHAACRMALQGYRDLYDGKGVATKRIMDAGKAGTLFDRYITGLLCMQVDLLNKGRAYYFESHELQRYKPNEPLLWFLLDQYDRQKTDPDLTCFYEALPWLYPDDAWVKQVVADRRKRLPKPKEPNFERMEELVDMFDADRWPTPDPALSEGAWQQRFWFAPGKVAGAAAILIRQGKIDDAQDLALRFHTMSVHVDRNALRIHANQILRRIDRARKQMPTTQPAR